MLCRQLGAAARRLASVVLVDARGADDGETTQQLAGGAAERNDGEAAHDARLGAREPALHALEAERARRAVVLVGDALLEMSLVSLIMDKARR